MTSESRHTTLFASLVFVSVFSACTGGQETTAQTLESGKTEKKDANSPSASTNPAVELAAISKAIPLYTGAGYRDDLTRRDSVMIRNQYGPQARVYTLATKDSFPQVWHYYVTYLAQFRAWDPAPPYPAENKDWRSLEVNLTQAMLDPFIPGVSMQGAAKQVVLQIAETEAEPRTVIRYIVTPASARMPVTVTTTAGQPSQVPLPAAAAAPGESVEDGAQR